MSRSNPNTDPPPGRAENPASTLSDWSDVAELQQRLAEEVEAMERMAADVGMAKHVVEYDSDRRKRALARAMQPALKGGDSAAKAEADGRASDTYASELQQLGKEFQNAVTLITEYDVRKLKWETARSLLAMKRTQVQIT